METEQRLFQYTLTDLIDSMTIGQISEVLGPKRRRSAAVDELSRLAHDVDLLMGRHEVAATPTLVRLMVLLAQSNLQVWLHKDRMAEQPDRYHELLKLAQDWNGIRNHVRNLMMEQLGEAEPSNVRATFLDDSGDRWYSAIICGLRQGRKGRRATVDGHV